MKIWIYETQGQSTQVRDSPHPRLKPRDTSPQLQRHRKPLQTPRLMEEAPHFQFDVLLIQGEFLLRTRNGLESLAHEQSHEPKLVVVANE